MSAAVVSAIAALSGVGLGQLLARSAEYRKWLRSERHAAARDLLAAAEALRTYAVRQIGDRYKGTIREDSADTYVAALERLSLALEAVRTVYPAPVAALGDQLETAAHAFASVLAELEQEQGQGPSLGDTYMTARAKFTDAARRLVAPTLASRLRAALSTGTAY